MSQEIEQKTIPNVKPIGKDEPNVPALGFPKIVDYLEFGELCEIRKRETIDSELLIEMDSLSQNTGELLKVYNINGAMSQKNTFKIGDVLFGKLRPYLNKHYLCNTSGYCSSEIWPLIPKKTNTNYLYSIIQSPQFIKEANITSGTKMPRADWNHLRTILIPIYSDEFNFKIGDLIVKIENKIHTQKKIIEDICSLKKQIINNLYSGICCKSKLSNFLIQVSKRNKNSMISNVLSVSNKNGFVKQSEQFEDREVASDDKTNYKIIEHNMFAYNPARINVGSIARYEKLEEGIISPMYICFNCNENLDSLYFEYFLESSEFKNEMLKRLEGSVRQCLSFESMANISFKILPLEIQKKNAAVITAFNNKINLENNYLEKLVLQKKYLLSKLFI